MKNKIPNFKNEAEQHAFWIRRDSTNYVDWGNAKKIRMPNLRPTLRTISLRLPESMLAQLKVLAHQRDVPRAVDRTSSKRSYTFRKLPPYLLQHETEQQEELRQVPTSACRRSEPRIRLLSGR